jgi:prepilin-type N-terminal cleavage/methylation domain-containing protein
MKDPSTKEQSRGFTLVELLVVVGIIAIMAAVSLPFIVGYVRQYKIKGAQQEVAKEIQAARGKAIGKNVNFGVVFMPISDTQYRWIIEDDQDPATGTPPYSTVRFAWPDLYNDNFDDLDAQRGPILTLPQGVVFSQACPNVTGPWVTGLRFGRLGSWCELGIDANCPAITVGSAFVQSVGATATVCLQQPDTGLTRIVTIAKGGRVTAQQ